MNMLFDAAEKTWPPAATHDIGPWTLRDGKGGGKRVSAATANGPITAQDVELAEAHMLQAKQTPLFMVRDGEDQLDSVLEQAGYSIIDPVIVFEAPITDIATEAPPKISTFAIWEPLKIMEEIWAEGGIGPARIEVMKRAAAPKTAIFGRSKDRAAGAAFVSIFGKIAVCHALEVASEQRRQGTAINMMRQAALWAQDNGAETLAVLVTESNLPARALYASLNMKPVGNYHYRIKNPKEA